MNSQLSERICSICKAKTFSVLAKRSDNLNILLCESCKIGVVEEILSKYYDSYNIEYYTSEQKTPSEGYTDYNLMAEHGVSWAAALINSLKPKGSILDIGCASGELLQSVGENYEKFGIEASTELANIAKSKGINIIGYDILNQSLLNNHTEKFDAITAIAVYEHVKNFKLALETSLKMLKDDGVLLFEVPIISENFSNEVWFNTSLEHIYYPTVEGLQNLFRNELRIALVGGELIIRDYAAVFIGIASRDQATLENIKATYERIVHAKPRDLSEEQRRVQILLKVIHGAETNGELLEYIHEIFPPPKDIKFLSRCIDLWKADVWRLQDAQEHIKQLEEAKNFHYNQAENYRRNWESLRSHNDQSIKQNEQ
ncbi:MAG: hypothetical protein CML16_14145 [Pusillimonas sp.]|nr:hypothetical protein [Pusillimonas sp.]MBC43460.1 hypothetical protein [Pusillimonas sp.]HCP78474.1 hypothetical protein [Pusillimonas sp.]|tara:strand:+ start:391 stop:1503 length:1113 start_codon:yes stop_codon:yes gene_type:complete